MGNVIKHSVRFLPQQLANQPNNKFPNIPPNDSIAPIHDVSSVVIGPDFIWESLDVRYDKLGDAQPLLAPYPIASKLTRN